MSINLFKKFYNEDVIYHYTKASTAIDFILHQNQLRFNKVQNSSDPIESKRPYRRTVSSLNSQYDAYEADELHAFIDSLEKTFNQICFCKNYIESDGNNENYYSNFKGNEEIFGFTKYRMWDQYADKFEGVCLAFSKEKILSLNKKNFKLIDKNIEYVTFQKLWEKKIGDIQGDYLQSIGKKEYQKELENIAKESFFYKHLDYSGENEYRIGTLFDKDKCDVEKHKGDFIFFHNMMLDITGCLEGIFVSSYANEKQKSDLLKYAIEHDVEIIEMKWEYNSFEPIDYKSEIKFYENIK